MDAPRDLPALIGQSPAFLEVMELTSRAAALERPVLVIGERGTGKELIAQRLHFLSGRWDKPLIKVNCAALPETLLETELFGHEAGAFTGAARRRAGRFERADGGSLFMDEIANASMAAQEKILRIVEYGELERVGASATLHVDVRVIAATNVDLPAEAAAGGFRLDLLDRLSFEVITVPPLRARREDIPVLADHFGQAMARELGWQAFPGFSERAMAALMGHPWPGNVREIKNAAERAVYRWADEEAPIDAIPFDPFASPFRPASEKPPGATAAAEAAPVPARLDLRAELGRTEKRLLEEALGAARFNQRVAARHLGLSYDQLRNRLRKHGLLERR
ncbi:phage shock protein operon transcriptional activator [Shumkonia mesophila]|uniref:phage shock protein operon transcriptional activator n=1 Tax=Shumkonia mesophila TaxID=2838854 RepID=UPI002934BFCF|nr:phage shock protein operon transcriptional activator [Shumkonia mesophila]